MQAAEINLEPKKRFYKKRWFKIFILIVIILAVVGGVMLYKAGWTLNKMSLKGNIFSSLVRSLPGVESKLQGEDEGRINIALLGMRGENVPGGGLLADTIMVVSIKPAENKVSMISIPRDTYVDNPGWGTKTKINAVYAAGEENGKQQGIDDMEKVLSDITGVPIHYGISINFKGFVDLIDALGGIDITLNETFTESVQFQEPHVCDPNVYTVPTGEYEIKKSGRTGKIKATYPLCYPDPQYRECGGNFTLPAGKNHLDGKTALCYVRSRLTSNDFERAKRQQIVLQLIKDKALSIGTLADFGKVSNIFNALGNNVRTDMEPWEMKRMFDTYQKMQNPTIKQKVLENTEEGLLYSQESQETGYILLPRGDNWDRVRQLFRDIFNQQ